VIGGEKMGELLTVKDLAQILRLHPATVYGLISSGSVQASRLPGGSLRIDAKELEKLLGQNTRRARAKPRRGTSAKSKK